MSVKDAANTVPDGALQPIDVEMKESTNMEESTANEVDEDPLLKDIDELPKDFVGDVHYVTSDSSAPPYMIKPFDKDRLTASRVLWALVGLLLWAFLIYYIVVQAQYLASKPTSTSLTREPQMRLFGQI
jgi:hypothetical protein